MPSTTPKYLLPYPLGTEPIADGDDAIKNLAVRIESVLGPNPGSVNYTANAVPYFEGSAVYLSGGLINLRLGARIVVGTSPGGVIARLPDPYWRPAVTARALCWNQAGPGVAVVPVTVTPTGDIYPEVAIAAEAILLGLVTYPTT